MTSKRENDSLAVEDNTQENTRSSPHLRPKRGMLKAVLWLLIFLGYLYKLTVVIVPDVARTLQVLLSAEQNCYKKMRWQVRDNVNMPSSGNSPTEPGELSLRELPTTYYTQLVAFLGQEAGRVWRYGAHKMEN